MATRTIKKSANIKSAVAKKTAGKATAKKSAPGKKVVNKRTRARTNSSKNSGKSSGNRSGNKFSLKSVLAINDVKNLYAELSKVLDVKKSISIDASAVEMVDTAVLQLLLAFIKKAQLQNITVTWLKPSKEFMNRAKLLNLTKLLGLQEAL